MLACVVSKAIASGSEVAGRSECGGEVDISVSGFMVARFKNQVDRIRGSMMKVSRH